MKYQILILFLLFTHLFYGQVTGYELQEVNVSDSSVRSTERILTIRRAQILELQPEDAGELLQKLAGVNIKSYGGLGGLKTISVRGLGSQHTSIVVDGFTLINNQTGQINLGQIQADNIERMYLVNGAQKGMLTPASAQVSGSAVFIETFENTFSNSKQSVRFSSRLGSYEQFDNYLSYKYSSNKWFIAAAGKFRFANGQYPYSFQNGTIIYSGIRNNNQYEDLGGNVSTGFKIGNHGVLNVAVKQIRSDQQLPGAVILYSDNAFQTLFSKETRIQTSYTHTLEKFAFRLYSSGAIQNIIYRDTTFLNNSGGIHSKYTQEAMQFGFSSFWRESEQWDFFMALEHQWSKLYSNGTILGEPIRNHVFALAGTKFKVHNVSITAQAAGQLVNESNESVDRDELFRLNPFAQLEWTPSNKLRITTSYRRSFRMPSFNELYYNNIGNIDLKPEDADQYSLGSLYAIQGSKFTMMNRSSVFYNRVQNKIVAVPTKNLFTWSMMNVGTTQIVGAESSFEMNFKYQKNWSLNLLVNYTFQSATDITDPDSPTYGHQLAYIPRHTGNGDLSVHFKKYGVRVSTFLNSMRYSLNENVPVNEVDGFAIMDVMVFGAFEWKQHELRIQFSIKNIQDRSYAIIRYYVMPGRSYLLSLNYAFN